MKSNSNYRRLAWSYSNSPSLEGFINKKLGSKKLYSWEYIDEESVKIFTISEDNENAYDSIEQIKEQLTKEGIKNFTL